MRRRVRLLGAAALSALALALLAAPAGATTTVVANEQYKWFWWIAPILAVSFLGIVAMLSAGYVRKVLLPKYRGRRVEE